MRTSGSDSDEATTETDDLPQDGPSGTPMLALLHPQRLNHVIEPGEVLLGRSEEAQLRLPGGRVSRLHSCLRRCQETVTISDARSRNGTYVNGRRVSESELFVGDVVRVGDWVGVFTREAPGDRSMVEAGPDMLAGPRLSRLLEQAKRVAPSSLPVVVRGESGTGKELMARFIHSQSGRRGPFVAINCAALPESLAESQLFGHVRGAFTGADRNHSGAFRRASGGTLLLDEIGDLPLAIQAKLLRALEEAEVTPLGAEQAIDIDVRLIVAGHDSLRQLVNEGRFRGDLFARVDGMELVIPPLRERKEEVLELFAHSFQRVGKCARPQMTAELAEALLIYEWPYNAREVRQVAHRMATLTRGQARELGLEDAPEVIVEARAHGAELGAIDAEGNETPKDFELDRLRASHKEEALALLRSALKRYDGNLSRAAQAIGISRGRAYRLIHKAAPSRDSDVN